MRHHEQSCTIRLLPGVTAAHVIAEAVRLFGLPDGPSLVGTKRAYVLRVSAVAEVANQVIDVFGDLPRAYAYFDASD